MEKKKKKENQEMEHVVFSKKKASWMEWRIDSNSEASSTYLVDNINTLRKV